MHKKSRVCVWERPDESSGPPDPTCCVCRKCYMARVQASGAAEPVSPSSSAGVSTQGSPAHDAVADKTGSNGRRGSGLEIWQAYPELHRAPPAATGSRETRPTGLAHEPGEAANVYERQAASEHSGVDAVQTGHENAAPPQDDGQDKSLAFPVFKAQQITACLSAPAPPPPPSPLPPMTDSSVEKPLPPSPTGTPAAQTVRWADDSISQRTPKGLRTSNSSVGEDRVVSAAQTLFGNEQQVQTAHGVLSSPKTVSPILP